MKYEINLAYKNGVCDFSTTTTAGSTEVAIKQAIKLAEDCGFPANPKKVAIREIKE